MKHIGLFEGIGGFSIAAKWMGWETVAYCEINSFCQKVLRKQFKNAKEYNDIYKSDFSIYRGSVDIVTGGWPCPKYSKAGKQEGNEPLKDELIRATKQIMPRWFVFENVPGLLTQKLSGEHDALINEMECAGYETRTFRISANHVGAKQIRERVWIIGYNKMGGNTNSQAGELGNVQDKIKKERAQNCIELLRNSFRFHWYEAISRVHRILNGLSRRLDGHRNAALGNAIVPQVALQIYRTIVEYENEMLIRSEMCGVGKKNKCNR